MGFIRKKRGHQTGIIYSIFLSSTSHHDKVEHFPGEVMFWKGLEKFLMSWQALGWTGSCDAWHGLGCWPGLLAWGALWLLGKAQGEILEANSRSWGITAQMLQAWVCSGQWIPASQPATHLSVHPSIYPSIHPPIHYWMLSIYYVPFCY